MSTSYDIGITPAYLDEIRGRIPISRIISEKLGLERAGDEWKALCPFHEEKTPSFIVNDKKGFYHCFGCGAHGDHIRWLTEQKGLSFREAVEKAAKTARVQLPRIDFATLEVMAEIICGSEGPVRRTAKQIELFFSRCDIALRIGGEDEFDVTLNALINAGAKERRNILTQLVSLRTYRGDPSKQEVALSKLEPMLALDGFEFDLERSEPVVVPRRKLGGAPQEIAQKNKTRKGGSVFLSYSHRDEELKDCLIAHLHSLKREGLIGVWHDRALLPGQGLDEAIERELANADLVVLLISSDFIASDYCIEKEMRKAFARQVSGDAKVICVVLRQCQWKNIPTISDRTLSDFVALPLDGKPVAQWPRVDDAFSQVVGEIRRLLKEPSP